MLEVIKHLKKTFSIMKKVFFHRLEIHILN
nr:MAG TPA: hypothetical protein [Caudoviricetes sp.]